MTASDPDVRQLVRAAMEQSKPSAGTRARSQARLVARLQTPPVPPGAESAPTPAEGSAGAAGTAAVAAKVAAAVLIAAGLTAAFVGATTDPGTTSPPPTVAAAPSPAVPAPTPVHPAHLAHLAHLAHPAAVAAPPTMPTVATPTAPVSPARPGDPSSDRTPVPAAVPNPESGPGLTDEARLVARANAALVRGDAAAARTHLRTHALQFPTGQLAREREALLHVAACLLDEPEARGAARAFLQRSGPSPRVADQCKLSAQ